MRLAEIVEKFKDELNGDKTELGEKVKDYVNVILDREEGRVVYSMYKERETHRRHGLVK
jgi:hypothetical protein